MDGAFRKAKDTIFFERLVCHLNVVHGMTAIDCQWQAFKNSIFLHDKTLAGKNLRLTILVR
jgi:hypothetical protein